ncbi:MAG: hypothetical protein EAZ58_13705 [Flavobacterium sp.]|nr:MAG: hypothetical protein EAZ58_13705 [Flavobacterium sp.]
MINTIIVDSLTNIGSLYEKELVDKHKRQSWTPAKEEFKKNFITFAHKNNINMIYCAREHQNDNGEIKPVGAMGISYDTSCVCNLSVCVKENVSERRWFCSKDRYTTLHDKTGKGYLTVSDFSHHIDKIVPFIPSEYCLEIANEIDAVDYFLGLQPIADRIKLDNTLSNQEKEFLRQKYSLKKKQYQHDIGGNVCSEKEV